MTDIIRERFALRRGTAAAWTAANPVLASGEEGYETDTGQRKVGDGATTWTALAYNSGGGGGGTVADATTSSKGVVQLAGDLGGTAAAPTVPGLTGKAPLASPALTGTPTAPTAAPGTNTTQVSTTAFVAAAITALINGAPGALDTLKELADALGDDASYAASITSALALKAPLASPTFTGDPKAPTPTAGDNDTSIATTAFVTGAISTQHTADNAAYEAVVNHGATAGTTRPTGAVRVFWIGSVAPTNGVDGDEWRDTTKNATRYNVAGVWFYPPGVELDYAERTSSDTTTNTARASASSNVISGLSATAVGTGQPVDIDIYVSAVVHSVAATAVNVDLIVNGVGAAEQLASIDSPITTQGRSLVLRRRKILTAGTSYTFQIGKYVGAAGTGTYAAAASNPMHISLTAR